MSSAFGVTTKRLSPYSMLSKFSPILSSRILIVVHFTFRSIIHFEITFVTYPFFKSSENPCFFSLHGFPQSLASANPPALQHLLISSLENWIVANRAKWLVGWLPLEIHQWWCFWSLDRRACVMSKLLGAVLWLITKRPHYLITHHIQDLTLCFPLSGSQCLWYSESWAIIQEQIHIT